MSVQRRFFHATLVLSISISAPMANAAIMDGSSQGTAAVSAKQLQSNYPGASSGLYWIDPTTGSTGDAFLTFVDMTTDGGGWTQALHSAIGAEPLHADIGANTGTIGGGFTVAVAPLAASTAAEIRHRIQFSNGALFHAKYVGQYYNPLPTVGSWTFLPGHTAGIESQLAPNFGQAWTMTTLGARWYTPGGGPIGVIPSTPANGLTGPFNSSGLGVNSYDVFVRELVTPTGNFDPVADLADSLVNLTPGPTSDTLVLDVSGSFDNDDQIVRYEFDFMNDGMYDLVLDVGSASFLQYWDAINDRFLIPESLVGPFDDFREFYPAVNGTGYASLSFTTRLRVTDMDGVTATDTATITFVPEIGSPVMLSGALGVLGSFMLIRRRQGWLVFGSRNLLS